MIKRQFRFKTDQFLINGIYNISGHIICSGHGYCLKTYCCKNCGEIFVVDLEPLLNLKIDLQTKFIDKVCPNCKDNLKNCLLPYPENIFYNKTIFKNTANIDRLHFEETHLLEAYAIN